MNKIIINEEKFTSIRQERKWPQWPKVITSDHINLKKVLESGRWTLSGYYTGGQTFDEEFCEKFAKYIGAKHCLTVDHGSNAILMCLQALGISHNDEVIVPALTWVSCATAVLRCNAKPVLVDIEEDTQCINPNEIEKHITKNTRAILVVHLSNCMANMDNIMELSRDYSVPVIEDCSQVHGSLWGKNKAGSIGHFGIFSMQQGKPLTCGEGAAVVTSDDFFYNRLSQLKFDGRILNKPFSKIGYQQLIEVGEVVGANFCLSEFQASILCSQLAELDNNNLLRADNAQFLTELLTKIPGIISLKPYSKNTFRAYYHYSVRYDKRFFSNFEIEQICYLLTKQLDTWVHPIYVPLYRHNLFQPYRDRRYRFIGELDYRNITLPVCEQEYHRTILFHHSCLLGNKKDMEDIYYAFQNIQRL